MIQMEHRIVLTEKCNKKCPHCFNAEQRKAAKHMDLDKLERFYIINQRWLSNAHFKIMGGEPTVHPEFLRLAELGLLLFAKTSLFTNGSKLDCILHPEILAAHWDDRFDFIINAFTFDFEEWNKYSKYFKGVYLHFVVPNNEKQAEMLMQKLFLCSQIPQATIILSGDTQVDLFHEESLKKYRKNYLLFMQSVIPKLQQVEVPYTYDHQLPACFWSQEMIDGLNQYGINPIHLDPWTSCCDTSLGLLDTNFDLWYCNQTRLKICNVLEKDGTPKDMNWIMSQIQKMPCRKEKTVSSYSYVCRNCRALPSCKTACWFKHVLPEGHKG